MDPSNSPYHLIRSLLEDYRAAQLSADDFEDALDLIDQRLQHLSEGLSMQASGPDPEFDADDEDDEEVEIDLSEVTLECLQLFADASDQLREFIEKNDDGAAIEGLELAREAHDLWLELIETRGDDIDYLERQLEDLQEV